MQGRNFRILSFSWASSALLLVVLILLNAVLARSATRIDLTEEGLYTLSDGSESILGKLEDPVNIKVFWHDVPVRFDHTKRYVAALLEEMEDASDGRVQSTWVDMSEDSGQDEADGLKVEPWVFQVTHGNEVRQAKGYMSLVIELGEEEPRTLDALFQIQDQLEYEIVSTIFQRSRSTRPVVGFISNKPFNPFGGGRQPGQFRVFEGMLTRTFGSGARTYLDLGSPVPEDVDVLILARPRNLTDEQVYRFEQFLLRGGRGILLLDPVDVDNVLGRASQQAEPHRSGLEEWLTHLGVTVERGVVADFTSTSLFPRSQTEVVRYPYWPKVTREHMELSNPVLRVTPAMPMYWPAALSVDMKKHEAEGRKATILATTTPGGYRRGDITGLGQADEAGEGKLLEEVPLIAMIEGPAKSFWLGKPIPGAKPAEPDEPGIKDLIGGGTDPEKGDAAPAKDGDKKAKEADAGAKDAPGGSPDGDGSPDGAGSPDGDTPGKAEPKKEAPKKGDPPPADDGSDGEDDADAEEEGPARLETGDMRLLVLGDADLIDDQLVRAFVTQRINGNVGPTFVLGAAEWLSGSDELLALRARAMDPRNLDEDMEDSTRDLLKHLNLGLVPLLVILLGLTVFIVRRSS